MAFIKEEIVEIRTKADIVDVIQDYGVSLTKQGKNYVGFCPFHDDKNNPSLVVSPEKQIFNCFTCKDKPSGGNVYTFVMKKEDVSFIEAVKILADKTGVKINVNLDTSANTKYKEEIEIYNYAHKYYMNNLNTKDGINAKKYLLERGITDEIIKEFKIGLALNEKTNLTDLLKNKYSVKLLDSIGLVNISGANIYDVFINRIMIPIENEYGQVIAFTGRIFNDEKIAKYLNTKETYLYKKSNIIFNYHNAKQSIKNTGKIIIVEGNMDAIKMSASGIKNVVALMGVNLSQEHINIIKKLRAEVTLMLDGDEAGKNATLGIGQLLIDNNISISVVSLSGAKDPDEYIEKFGKDKLLNLINNPVSFFEYKMNALKNNKNLNNIDELIKYIKEVLASIKYEDELSKNIALCRISKEYNVDINILKKELEKKAIVKNEKKQPEKILVKKLSRYDKAVNKILFYMMNDPMYITIYKNRLGYFKNIGERKLASEIVNYYNIYKKINIADFTSFMMTNMEIYDKVLEIIQQNGDFFTDEEDFNSNIDVILEELKKQEISELKQKIKSELDVNKKVDLLNKLAELKKGSVEYEGN